MSTCTMLQVRYVILWPSTTSMWNTVSSRKSSEPAEPCGALVNGDCYYGDPDLRGALEFHERNGSLGTMVLIDMPPGESYRGVEIAGGGRLVRVAGSPGSSAGGSRTLHFTGIHILEPEFVAGIGPGFSDINSRHYPRLIEAGSPVFGYHTSFRWFDLGTPLWFLSAAAELIQESAADGSPGRALIAGAGCDLDSSSVLNGPLELGAGCRIGANAVVANSVLGKGVAVGPDARVTDSLLGDGFRVEAGKRLDGVVAAVVEQRPVISSWKEPS
ncbi:MAG: NDP-sugar synthase [Candidatus Glassbacteria bacterium]|nr:NDP-sugar synthase [Candidatus Glassbacteria bacterium]